MRCVYTTTIDVEVEYDFTPGRPERGPSYSSGGEPADPPEVEVVNIWVLGDKGNALFALHTMCLTQAVTKILLGKNYEDTLITNGGEAMADMADEAAERRADLRKDR